MPCSHQPPCRVRVRCRTDKRTRVTMRGNPIGEDVAEQVRGIVLTGAIHRVRNHAHCYSVAARLEVLTYRDPTGLLPRRDALNPAFGGSLSGAPAAALINGP